MKLHHRIESVLTSPEVEVNKERCVGCQDCIRRCPTGALGIDSGRWIAQVDNDLCVGCRQCQRVCAFSAIVVNGPVMVADPVRIPEHHPDYIRNNIEEVRTGFTSWEEALTEAYRCLDCPDPTCVRGCPAQNDIPGFIRAIRSQDLPGAHNILSRTTMLPDACSRVCDWDNQCQGACTWTLAGKEPVAIGKLERFITEFGEFGEFSIAPTVSSKKRVAVVGSGPAGLAAAWELLSNGVQVDIYEKADDAGGVMHWGIPSYVLPDKVPQRVIGTLEENGAVFHTGTTLGIDITLEDLSGTFDDVILAYGASKAMHMPLPGVDLEGVEDADKFLLEGKTLLQYNSLSRGWEGKRILVLGAGNTAMDVARTSLRLGAKPIAIDWMNESFARVRHDELAEARLEGVEVSFLTTLVELKGENGEVTTAVLRKTTQPVASESPKIIPDSTYSIDVDVVVFAMGYQVDASIAREVMVLPHKLPNVKEEIHNRRWLASGIFSVESPTVGELAMQRHELRELAEKGIGNNIWAVGDAFSGPSTVVTAMSQGRDAARVIINALS